MGAVGSMPAGFAVGLAGLDPNSTPDEVPGSVATGAQQTRGPPPTEHRPFQKCPWTVAVRLPDALPGGRASAGAVWRRSRGENPGRSLKRAMFSCMGER